MRVFYLQKVLLLFPGVLLYGSVFCQIIPFGSTWKYYANTLALSPGASWTESTFDDSSWPSGPGKLGFGGDGEITCIPAGASGCTAGCIPGSTCIKYTTTYFRKKVTITGLSSFNGFLLSMIRDDGAIVYVNGTEVWRTNIPGGIVSYSTYASTAVAGATENSVFVSPLIPKDVFLEGDNIISVEVHQVNDLSSDLGFDLQLTANPLIANEVIYLWCGALQPGSVKVNAKMSNASNQIRLVVSTDPGLTNPVYGPYATADATHNFMAAMSIDGLSAATKYYYAVQSDGITDASADDTGTFTTPPAGPFSFTFTVGSCALTGNHPVFTKMAANHPLFNMIIGDFHYSNPNSATDINVHRIPYETFILSQTPTRDMLLNYPLAYIWDDHDFSGNDSDSTAAGKTNARLAYREYVPYYPMGAGIIEDRPIYQSFTIGRIHFILTDLRSSKRVPTMMGTVQKAWFKNECLFARDNNMIIAWVCSVSWGGNVADNWGGFAAERTELANFFRDNSISNMFIMSGDAHMSAIDNGNNHDFTTGIPNPNKYPVLAAAALNQSGSNKGGIYSETGIVTPNGTNNTYPNPNNTIGQYGLVQVTDAGGSQICIKLTSYRVTNNPSDPQQELVNYNFCRNMLVVVPVSFTGFNVNYTNNKQSAFISWQMGAAPGCNRYLIERSNDGSVFKTIGQINCRNEGNSVQYDFTDNNPMNGNNFYRVRAEDQQLHNNYTAIKSLYFQKQFILIAPNPVRQQLLLLFQTSNTPAKYFIYNSTMQQLLSGKLNLYRDLSYPIKMESITPGVYFIRVVTEENSFIKKFIKE